MLKICCKDSEFVYICKIKLPGSVRLWAIVLIKVNYSIN